MAMISFKGGTIAERTCECRRVTLWRGFGKWPTHEFSALTPDAQKQFYRDIHNKWGVRDIVAMALEVIEGFETNMDIYACEGEYRPLGFWEKEGWKAWTSSTCEMIKKPMSERCWL